MGTIIIDKNGEADLSFHNIPLYAVKKATFKTKLGVLHDLLKMTVKGIIYNFSETAKNGAVIFANSYENWEFISPDGVLDYAGYASMSIGDALAAVKSATAETPIPAWDRFIIWLSNKANSASVVVGNISATYLIAPDGTQSTVNNMVFSSSWSNFSDFLDAIIDCVEPASGNSMSLYSNGSGFSCTLKMVNTSGSATSMTFQFRE